MEQGEEDGIPVTQHGCASRAQDVSPGMGTAPKAHKGPQHGRTKTKICILPMPSRDLNGTNPTRRMGHSFLQPLTHAGSWLQPPAPCPDAVPALSLAMGTGPSPPPSAKHGGKHPKTPTPIPLRQLETHTAGKG